MMNLSTKTISFRRCSSILCILLCYVSVSEAWNSAAYQKSNLATLSSSRRSTFSRKKDASDSVPNLCRKGAFGTCPLQVRGGAENRPRYVSYSTTVTERPVVSAAATSLLAGALAGSVGVGVAFPLDTLKTKAQVIKSAPGTTLSQVVREIYKQEGIAGFFGGVRGMMIGQAVIKSIAFSVNAVTLALLQQNFPDVPAVALLLTASCFSGFVTSFVVTPVERVKVMMQASSGVYVNELDCLQAILRKEGWGGLLGRGLGPTLAREVPSYGIYFFIYGFLMQTQAAAWLGSVAPLIFGALSGMSSWLPVYPVDVVKTIVQNTEGDDISAFQVVGDLYKEGGVGAFFDGLTPKMMRAAINHAVTFYLYDLILTFMSRFS